MLSSRCRLREVLGNRPGELLRGRPGLMSVPIALGRDQTHRQVEDDTWVIDKSSGGGRKGSAEPSLRNGEELVWVSLDRWL